MCTKQAYILLFSPNLVVYLYYGSASLTRPDQHHSQFLDLDSCYLGPIPSHIAFIMDGNRRFSKKNKLMEGAGHRAGFSALMSMLKYCYEFRVKYVTIYAFSIDNFRRRPEEVQSVMDLMLEKIEGLTKQESIVNQYGVKVRFVGNLQLLSEPVRLAAERAMVATAENSKAVLTICVAYSATDEILHAVRESCEEKRDEISALEATGSGPYGLLGLNSNEKEQEKCFIDLRDIEKHINRYSGIYINLSVYPYTRIKPIA
ncbi:Alkyl transferase [Heracleum sosnowskyi]|uniref:Alkyl transferase n=1 Tax=Heracleum sosnowskyi TaxID=360622 RepID=A0AAD8J4Y9_9APIA|nr:Alkyl transferase [Heracleum sosnowskyi]